MYCKGGDIMIYFPILVVALVFALLALIIWQQSITNEALTLKIEALTRKISILEESNQAYVKAIAILDEECRQIKNKTYIPDGTIEAVKDAMKRSHPDNGGNTEDFQKYRRAYNILMKGGY